MNRKMLGAVLGVAVLMASGAASAHVDVAIGLGVPGVYAPPPPVYVAPPAVYAPVAVGYRGYDDGWRAREWLEHEWRRREWREHEWREHAWRDRGRWGD